MDSIRVFLPVLAVLIHHSSCNPLSSHRIKGLNGFSVPILDLSIDPYDPTHLVPSQQHILKYIDGSDQPTSDPSMVHITVNLTQPALILENSDFIKDVACSPSSDMVQFSVPDSSAHSILSRSLANLNKHLVIVTNSKTCNPANQRGIYRIDVNPGILHPQYTRTYSFRATRKDLEDFVATADVSYSASPDEATTRLGLQRRAAAESGPFCTPNPWEMNNGYECFVRGYTARPRGATIEKAKSFDACKRLCLEVPTCMSFGWSSFSDLKMCWTSTVSLAKQRPVFDPYSPMLMFERDCWACRTSTTSILTTTSSQIISSTKPSTSSAISSRSSSLSTSSGSSSTRSTIIAISSTKYTTSTTIIDYWPTTTSSTKCSTPSVTSKTPSATTSPTRSTSSSTTTTTTTTTSSSKSATLLTSTTLSMKYTISTSTSTTSSASRITSSTISTVSLSTSTSFSSTNTAVSATSTSSVASSTRPSSSALPSSTVNASLTSSTSSIITRSSTSILSSGSPLASQSSSTLGSGTSSASSGSVFPTAYSSSSSTGSSSTGSSSTGSSSTGSSSTGSSAISTSSSAAPSASNATCDNQGSEWFVFNIDWPNVSSVFGGLVYFRMNQLQNKKPIDFGVIPSIGSLYASSQTDGPLTSYGGTVSFPPTQYIVLTQGYILAPTTGTYMFTINQAGNYGAAFWGAVGSAAYDNLSGNQANIIGNPPSPNYFFQTLEAGKYYPWRVLIAVGNSPKVLDTWTISFPNGSAWLNGDTSYGSEYVVRFSCDGVSAPRRPPFPGTF